MAARYCSRSSPARPSSLAALAILAVLLHPATPAIAGSGAEKSGQSTEPAAEASRAEPPQPAGSSPGGDALNSPGRPEAPASDESDTLRGKADPQEEDLAARRTELNLLGQTDTASGESRRNENVKFNPIDNNALRELNFRVGVTATIVEEFEPQKDYYGAEFGSRPGLPIHLVSSPAAAVHGNLYGIHNNSVFNARSFFQVGDVKPARENNYGFSVSAPVWKAATVSLDASQQKVRGSVNGNILVPNTNERTPLTNDPRTRPIVEKFLAAYPTEPPNRPDIDDRALNVNSPQSIDTDRAGGVLDQGLGGKDRLLVRYGFTSQSIEAFQFVAGQNPDSDVRAHTSRITWNRVWTPNTITNFSAGFDRTGTLLRSEENAVGPSVSIFIIERLGPRSSIPLDRVINDFQYSGQLRHARGNHQWRAGFGLLRRQFNGEEANDHRGTFRFGNNFGRDAVTNLRMGTPTRYSVTIGATGRGFRNWDLGFYAGDKWQASDDLTLNFGLRYEPITRPSEVHQLDEVPYDCDCNNLAPNFGFAYRLPGLWGTLRGAYGVHYGRILPATYGQTRFNPPGNVGIVVDEPSLSDPLGGRDPNDLDPNTRSSLTLLSPDLVAPYSHQYNFSWEPDFWRHVKLQLGYVGSRTHKLFQSWSVNRGRQVEGVPQTSATVNQRRPNPNFFTIGRVINGSRGYYDAARVSLSVPQWRGLSIEASYWLSKAIDLGTDYTNTGTGGGGAQSEFLIHEDSKSLSSFDQPHAFLARGSYDLPSLASHPGWAREVFGSWRISGVVLIKSGTPFSVFAGSDAPGFGNVDGQNGDRVHILDPSILGRTIGDPDASIRLLPRQAFAFIAPTDLRGSIGRNTFRKGKIANANVAISRTWKLASEQSLTFRAESINLLNTPQFADPVRDLASKTFGRITNTLNDGRAFQFMLRFAF